MRAKIAQMLILGLKSQELCDVDQSNLSKIAPGAVILFKHNYSNLDQLLSLNKSILECVEKNSYENISPWISVDQEGGRVIRLGEPFTAFPAQDQWGASTSSYATTLAKELRAAGICVNFSPVVDVKQNESLVIGDRSFSSDPNKVAESATQVLEAYEREGVMGVIKHFPGHGAVSEDSHYEQPICYKTLQELRELDLIPFQKLVKFGCEAIMTAHILFPNIDAKYISTFSQEFLQKILRKDFSFEGLVISDDLEMKAASQEYSYEESAFLALEAGCDSVFLCHRYQLFEKVYEYLVKKHETGDLSKEKIEVSWKRIKKLKTKYLISSKQFSVSNASVKIPGAV